MFIFLAGNISDGFKAYGPYSTFDDVCEFHDMNEGWVMELSYPDKMEV